MSKHLAPQQKGLSEMIQPFNHVIPELWAADGALCSGLSSDVSFTHLSHNNTLWCLCSSGFDSRCTPEGFRFKQADETLMNLANMCLSTGSAFTLSVEYCISSYKHLLWRVQGPVFTEHLFSQMILLLSPAQLTSELGQGWTTASPPCCDLFLHALVHLTVL